MNLDPNLRKRLDQLVDGGYIRKVPDFSRCILTDKGMAVLLAGADRPIKAEELKKPSLTSERLTAELNLFLARKFLEANPSLISNQDKES